MQELTSIDWTAIVQRLEEFSTCEQARQILESTGPLESPEKCIKSFSIIEEARYVIAAGQRPFFESVDLFSTWHQRLQRSATLKNRELRDVRSFCLEILALFEVLTPYESEWITGRREELMDAEEILERIDRILTPDGEIRSDASETLSRLFKEKNQLSVDIQKALDRVVKDNQLETVLQDRYVTTREGRWVLPVKSGMRHSFDGIIHASSQSKQTVFMEPRDIIPSNNRLRQLEVEIEDEIELLLTLLSQFLTSKVDDLERSKEIALECDIRFSQARLAIQLDAHPCRFAPDSGFELHELRHPVLVLANEPVVANTITLTPDKRLLLLSGPNAGGKTVLLKAIGLAAQMARCGLPVCAAEDSFLPFIRRIYVGVGDQQSVGQQLSTFAAHLKVLDDASKAKSSDELILIDEICGSTDPEEGAALARSFVECYANSGSYAVITSHLGALKSGWEESSTVINGSLEFSTDTGPTYQFILGVPGQSLAIQTAQRVGISKEIIERALSHLSPDAKQYQKSLQEVEKYREEIAQLREDLIQERREFNKKKSKYESLIQSFEKEKSKLLEDSVKRAERDVDKMIKHAKVEEVFQKHSALQKVKSELPKVIKTPTRGQAIESVEDFYKAYPPGSRVYVASIGKEAVIQGEANSKGEIPILANSMRLTVHWSDIKPTTQPTKSTRQILRNHVNVNVPIDDGQSIIDLRGKRVDDALEIVERTLDQAAAREFDRVKIIHGHGTSDALKRAIRSYLSRSPYVKKWNAGRKESGGDGVTWVELL